jgi:hypothetical protein
MLATMALGGGEKCERQASSRRAAYCLSARYEAIASHADLPNGP